MGTAIVSTSQGVMTGQQAGSRNRIQWGPIDQNGSWTASQVTQANSQDLPDGGWVRGLVGLEQQPVTPGRAAGALLVVAGVLCIKYL